MDGKSWNNPPCTGTRYVSGTEHLIPEYYCSYDKEAKNRTEIADGAILL